MEKITKAQIKIIDFNHSRMFTLDDSPFIRRKAAFKKASFTEEDIWQEMIEQPSPVRWRTVTKGFGHTPSDMTIADAIDTEDSKQEAKAEDDGQMAEQKLNFAK